MRKVVALSSVAIIFAILNFSLWLYHSRAIDDSLTFARKLFAMKDYTFEYKDSYFDSFKFWRLVTVINDLKISKNNQEYIYFKEIRLISMPLEKTIEIVTVSDINLRTEAQFGDFVRKAIYDPKNPPKITVELENLFEVISHGLFDSSAPNPLGNINSVNYQDNGFTVFDLDSSQEYLSIAPSKAGFMTYKEPAESGFILNLNVGINKLNTQYQAATELLQQHFQNNLFFNNAELNAKVKFRNYFSEKYLNFLKESKEQNKDIKNARFDMFSANVESVEYRSPNCTLSLKGVVDKSQTFSIPYFNLDLTVNNFNSSLRAYLRYVNDVIASSLKDPRFNKFKIASISPQQEDKMLEFFSQFVDDNSNLKMNIIRSESIKSPEINGKPLIDLFSNLNSILPEFIPLINFKFD